MSDATKAMFGVHADALSLRQQRMQVIAANIANADTPGYKAQDIDFAGALQQLQGGNGGVRLAASRPGHLGATPGGEGPAERVYRLTSQPSLDGNTVDAQAEHAAFAQAALEYRASLSFVEARVRTLLTAITGQ
ncbi:MAG: flagellar basal body rod protein FlgB [Lysobacteraceae bacterium]